MLRRGAPRPTFATALLALLLAAVACEAEWRFWTPAVSQSSEDPRLPVVFLSNGPPDSLPAEETAALEWLRSEAGFAVEPVQIIDLPRTRLPTGAVIWWHFAEEPSLPSAAVRPEVMAVVRRHLEGGGGVLLSLLAASYVVPLGLETVPPDLSQLDGRDARSPVGGFQSNLGHPLLRRFWGGVDTSTPSPGRTYSAALYTGERWPQVGRVWAVERRYLETAPRVKVGVAYPPTADRPGGTLVTVGAHCYFSDPGNRYRRQLQLLVGDSLHYVAGNELPIPPAAAIPSTGAVNLDASTGSESASAPLATAGAASWPPVLTETNYWEPLGGAVLGLDAPATGAPAIASDGAVLEAVAAARSGLSSERSDPTDAPFTLASPRTLAAGLQRGRVTELWAHPVRVLRDLRFGIVRPRRPIAWLDADRAERTYTARPEGSTLRYTNGDLEVTLHLSVDRIRPALVALLEIRSPEPVEVIATWQTDHGLGWPQEQPVLGPLYVGWDAGAHAGVWRDRRGSFQAMAGFGRQPTVHVIGYRPDRHLPNDRLLTAPVAEPAVDEPLASASIAVQVSFDPASEAVLPFVAVGGMTADVDVRQAYADLFSQPASVWSRNASYFRAFLARTLEIDTPDDEFDEAFRWAEVGIEALRVTTPGMGTGIASAYALRTDRRSLASGHGAYVGADAAWGAMAANAYGGTDLSSEALRLLARYQDVEGRIPQILSPGWSLRFDAADGAPLFVIAVDQHVRGTGDLDTLRALWPAVRAAIEYCIAADHDGDGLMDETPYASSAVWGSQQQDVPSARPAAAGEPGNGDTETATDPATPSDALSAELSPAAVVSDVALRDPHTTIYLVGLWNAALESAARLATWMQDAELAGSVEVQAARVREVLNTEFWDPSARYFRYAKTAGGSFVPGRTLMPALPMVFELLDAGEATPVLEALASAGFTTDWGVRRVDHSTGVRPSGDLVRPLFTGWAALAEYAYHRPSAAYLHTLANLRLYRQGNLGFLGDAFDDERFEPVGSGVLTATSQAMALLPVVHGLLGIRANAVEGTLAIVPHLPPHWDRVTASPVRVGDTAFRVTINRTPDSMRFVVERLGGTRPVRLTLGARVPSEVLVNLNRENTLGVTIGPEEIVSSPFDTASMVPLTLAGDRAEIVFRHEPYPALIPEPPELAAGSGSTGLRVVDSRYHAGQLALTLEGLPGRTYALRLTTPWPVSDLAGVPGASVVAAGPGEAQIEATIPGTGDRHHRVELVISFRR